MFKPYLRSHFVVCFWAFAARFLGGLLYLSDKYFYGINSFIKKIVNKSKFFFG